MITGTLITVLSIPMYWGLFHARGLMGLAIASDIGILVQTAALALLLHRKRLVSLAHLEFGELGRALLAALVAFAATAAAAHLLPPVSTYARDLVTIAAILTIIGSLPALDTSGVGHTTDHEDVTGRSLTRMVVPAVDAPHRAREPRQGSFQAG